MNILITGSSGFIGRNIAYALMRRGHQIRHVSRSHGHDFCELTQAEDWMPLLQGIDAVINCVGIIAETRGQSFRILHTAAPCALFKACVAGDIRRVIQISALGADETAFSAYHLSKCAADNYLRSLDLDWFVIRPSLIYGQGGKSAKLFMRLATLPLIPVIGDGTQKIQPIHIHDVVATVLQCLLEEEARFTLDVLGEQIFTFADWLQFIRTALGLPKARILPIPTKLVMAGMTVGKYLSPMLSPDNVRMLLTGYLASTQPLCHFLDRAPLRAEARLFFSDEASMEIPS